jgi:hypothetical protein
MSTPSIGGINNEIGQTGNVGQLIYTVPSGSDQTIVVHVYMTLNPQGNPGIGVPSLAYTDEFGAQSYLLEHTGSSRLMGISVPLRVKAGTTVTLNASPSGETSWSVYTAVEVVSAT